MRNAEHKDEFRALKLGGSGGKWAKFSCLPVQCSALVSWRMVFFFWKLKVFKNIFSGTDSKFVLLFICRPRAPSVALAVPLPVAQYLPQ